MLNLLFLLLFLNKGVSSFYLPVEYREKREARMEQARTYLKKYGYYENTPLCSDKQKNNFVCAIPNPKTNKITEEEALKKFQQNVGIEANGRIDDATIQMMNEARCGNSDIQKTFKANVLPWKDRWITYAFLNFSEKLETKEVRDTLTKAFLIWQMVTPLKFYETRRIEKAGIKILFAKREHGDEDAFDGDGGTYAHAYPDGRLHFDDEEEWTTYSTYDQPEYPKKDLLFTAIHEIGHVLRLPHLFVPDSIMTPMNRSPMKRDNTYDMGYYSKPKLISTDIEFVQKIYGGRVSKASKNAMSPSAECSEFCFI